MDARASSESATAVVAAASPAPATSFSEGAESFPASFTFRRRASVQELIDDIRRKTGDDIDEEAQGTQRRSHRRSSREAEMVEDAVAALAASRQEKVASALKAAAASPTDGNDTRKSPRRRKSRSADGQKPPTPRVDHRVIDAVSQKMSTTTTQKYEKLYQPSSGEQLPES